ncbi:uncharacterized protein EV420DRAFT_1300541 [Desarmillaria tabescens]|uniref:LYC1 C-terminal domain-containing protein n=1 Tax=Armillaria tabescens TaxID=1929756 RepID=A0AA39U567_ARMTA|nr:uncharacterized protein EV420DRAFT_1300541 [Desarmillaria tabescens]KAK0467250.1 hypothetical protein EV420DRAFT_1300541 [Desarmillaria tabescens]
MSLLSLSLFPATQAQTIESRRRSFKEWGRSMTEEEYLRRDAEMDSDEHASNRRLTTWVLCSREDPESLGFKCSCETFRRRGLVLRRNSVQLDNDALGEVVCYAIASVFTPERFRRQGYAKHMMRLLHWVLASPSSLPSTFPAAWGLPPEKPSWLAHGHFSALWSDVGHFYQSCGPTTDTQGWIVRDAISTIWNVEAGDTDVDTSRRWQWLSASDVETLHSIDDQRIKADMAAMSLASSVGETFFTFLPGQGVEKFQKSRLEHVWGKFKPSVEHWGVVCGPIEPGKTMTTSDEHTAMATWTFEMKPPTLLVTRLRAGKENFLDLVSALKFVARMHGMERIEIWNLPEVHKSIAQEHGAVHIEREEHLPAFKWNGAEASNNVVWLNNEKCVPSFYKKKHFEANVVKVLLVLSIIGNSW